MQKTVFQNSQLHWIDIIQPSEEELSSLSEQYGLPLAVTKDCLQPEHLPKYEVFSDSLFFIFRSYDHESTSEQYTIQQITRKTAVFVKGNLLITIHRKDLPFIAELRDRKDLETLTPLSLTIRIMKRVIMSYDSPLQKAEENFECLEDQLLNKKTENNFIEYLYYLKKRIISIRKILRMQVDLIHRVEQFPKNLTSSLLDTREEGDRMFLFADHLLENSHHIMETHLSLSAHHTNDIMRILTVFSAFFMPVTFIVGVYGMNFRFMPELEHKWGYPVAVIGMGLVTAGIYFWMKKRGWLK